MSLYIPELTTPVTPSSMVQIERRLPYPGEILVRAGSRVEPEDIIARALVPLPPRIINVARMLAIAPRQVERAMRREVGNKVRANEILARTSRIGGRSCTAAVDGVIAAVDHETGYVTIDPDPIEEQLQANVRGVVMAVQPAESVIIETPAAQVYGVFGIGRERAGVLRLLVTDPNEIVEPEMIDNRSAYAVLICGAGISAAALRRAVQVNVHGIIVGGIEEAELRTFLGWAGNDVWQIGASGWQIPRAGNDPGLTLLVTEGFGIRPMSQPIFELLSAQDRQEALIEGTTRLRQPLRRPRVVIPLTRSAGVEVKPPPVELRAGATVRLLDPAHLGQVGQVRTLPATPRRIASGARVHAVEVVQTEGAAIWLPRTAVEVLA